MHYLGQWGWGGPGHSWALKWQRARSPWRGPSSRARISVGAHRFTALHPWTNISFVSCWSSTSWRAASRPWGWTSTAPLGAVWHIGDGGCHGPRRRRGRELSRMERRPSRMGRRPSRMEKWPPRMERRPLRMNSSCSHSKKLASVGARSLLPILQHICGGSPADTLLTEGYSLTDSSSRQKNETLPSRWNHTKIFDICK